MSCKRLSILTIGRTFDVAWTDSGLRVWENGREHQTDRESETFVEFKASPVTRGVNSIQEAKRHGPDPFEDDGDVTVYPEVRR